MCSFCSLNFADLAPKFCKHWVGSGWAGGAPLDAVSPAACSEIGPLTKSDAEGLSAISAISAVVLYQSDTKPFSLFRVQPESAKKKSMFGWGVKPSGAEPCSDDLGLCGSHASKQVSLGNAGDY